MACMKLGSKTDAFRRQGQAWFCTTGLPSDVVVQVEEMSFHLHKFPLLSRSGVMERLIAEASQGEEGCVIKLSNVPGAAKTFELVAKFCYGVKLELTASNVVHLRCAAEHLEMTEEYGEGNLISQTEIFLNQTVLSSWKDSLKALQTCDDMLSEAEQLHVPKRCIDSLAAKACTDPALFGWPMAERGGPMQSPGGSVLWNGISTGARPKHSSADWWYEDASTLTLPLYKKLVSAIESRGVKQEMIAGSLVCYARKYLPGLNRRQGGSEESTNRLATVGSAALLSEQDQKTLVEEIDRLLPLQTGLVPTKHLFGLLRTARILQADASCISNLEKRIGMQLDQATLEDLLMPNVSYSMETLYDVDCVQRILEHFLTMDQVVGDASPGSVDDGQSMELPSLTPITMVAKLIDGYLAEVAPDVHLKLTKFHSLTAAVPEYARPLDDGLYRAIDVYLKSHPWLTEPEREQLCRLMDCQKLSLEACTHAAQNERLPLRIIVQVLFFEQLQLRTSIAGCFLVSENLDGSKQLRSGLVGANENQVLKVGMDSMRLRVTELEKECSNMREEIDKLGKAKGSSPSSVWGNVSKKFGFRLKSQMCSAQEGSVSKQKNDKVGEKQGKGKKKVHLNEQKKLIS
ncbi:BTB/POZ domain-containing protein-like protein [Salvia divinorum]|uniref:BTB/POZ domain-containing protein-like protein n=1 Tax=Salvia divinorum TaxID=28513 RepID=A0ABD1HVI4_SALDI